MLTVMIDVQRLSETMRRLASQGEHPLFLFKAIAPRALASPQASLLDGAWDRAGQEPLHIDR